MAEKLKDASSSLDTVKWIVVLVLVAGAVYGNNYFAAESMLYRVIGLLAVAGIAGFIAAQTAKGRAFLELGREARTEIRKVVWPTRQETTQTTMIVVVVVILVSIVLWGLDSTISWLISLLVGS